MPARLLEGRPVSASIGDAVRARAHALAERGVTPAAVVFVADGDRPGTVYAHSIARRGKSCGVAIRIETLATADASLAPAIVRRVGGESGIHGVLVQRPLPSTFDAAAVTEAIPLDKDVDAAHPYSLGLLFAGRPRFVPATAAAVLEMLAHANVPLSGKRVTIIGRSPVVGKPLAFALLAADATVTICHSRTNGLREICAASDVVVAALGKPHFVGADMIRAGATVIDVGTNIIGEKIVGDVDPKVAEVAGALSPVPGGVGPVTTAVFLRNVAQAAESQTR